MKHIYQTAALWLGLALAFALGCASEKPKLLMNRRTISVV